MQPKKKSLQIKSGNVRRESPTIIASSGIVPGNSIKTKATRMQTKNRVTNLLTITIFNSERAFRGYLAAEWKTYDS